MVRRAYFIEEQKRKQFFAIIKHVSGYSSNKKIADFLKTSKSAIEKYVNGKLTVPEHKLLDMFSLLPSEYRSLFEPEIGYMANNWGQAKAGKITSCLYPHIFAKGRKLASEKNMKTMDFNLPLSLEFCEIIGAFIGDGFIGSYSGNRILQFTGDARLDKEYYRDVILPYFSKLFPNLIPQLITLENTLRVTFNSKRLVELFRLRFDMPLGKKCYSVLVPNEILSSEQSKICATLRGIFDTDGCVFFDRRKCYKSPYVRIGLHLNNPELIRQISKLLLRLKIKHTVTRACDNIQINGTEQVKSFVRTIGFSNFRHLLKIRKALGEI